MGKIGFVHDEGHFFSFDSIFFFKHTMEQILIQAQPLKMLNKFCLLIIGLQANFLRPCAPK